MVGGQSYNVAWKVSWGTAITHADVHWALDDPAETQLPCADTLNSTCRGAAVITPRGPGAFEAAITAPGVSQPTQFKYRVHVVADGVDLWSPVTSAWSYPAPPTGPATPALQFDRSAIAFAAQPVYSASLASAVEVRNVGAADLQISGVAVGGDFYVSEDECSGRTLALDERCRIAVLFVPAATGYRSGALTVVSNAPGSPHHVALSGSGIAPAGPQISFSAAQLTFAAQATGVPSAEQTVVVRNLGTLPLAIGSATIGGAHVSDFQKTFDTCSGASIAVGAACAVGVTFIPTVAGSRTARLDLSDNAPGGSHHVSLTGSGTSPSGAAVTIFPTSLGFSDQEVATSSPTQTVTLRNITGASMTIINIFRGNGDPDFSVTGAGALPLLLPSGGASTFGVQFTAQASGVRSGYITVAYNLGAGPLTVSLPVRGTGTPAPPPPAPALELSSASFAFGAQLVGSTSPSQTLTLHNAGSAELRITNIYFGGAQPTDFDRDSNCFGNFAAGATCSMGVRFRPQAGGTRNATLLVESNAAGSPQPVSLSGVATLAGNPAATLNPPAMSFGPQPSGSLSRVQRFTLTNNGLSPLHISSMTVTGANPPDFSLSLSTFDCGTITLPATFGVGVSCSFDARFTPTGLGTRSATVTIVDDAPDSPQHLLLSGDGTAAVTIAPITEFPVLTPNARPFGIAAGPDGNLWFTEADAGRIGRITPEGNIVEFPPLAACPGRASSPFPAGITTGPDGNLWFTDDNCAQIGRMTPSGDVIKYNLPVAGSGARFIVSGPDGNLWFTEGTAGRVGRITTAGVITEVTLPSGGNPQGIAVGGDGNLWFGELSGKKLGRLTLLGALTEYPLPSMVGAYGVTAGPDGNVWFAENSQFAGQIGRISPSGQVLEMPISQVPFVRNGPAGIAMGRDGALWFTELEAGLIGRMTPDGGLAEFTIPTANSSPLGIASGPDGNIWFTEGSGKIGRIRLPLTPGATLSTTGLQFAAQLLGIAGAAQPLTLTNTGNTILTVSAVALDGAQPGDFALLSNGCAGAQLAPGASCALSVRFQPTGIGVRSASVTITDNAPGSPHSATLAGTGSAPSPSPTPTASSTASLTPTRTATSSPSATATRTVTRTPTTTATATPTSSATPSQTATRSATATRTATASATSTPTATVTSTRTSSATPTSSATASATRSATGTASGTPTRSATRTQTGTPTQSATRTPTASATSSSTPTATLTRTATVTRSETPSATPTNTASPTASPSATRTATPSQSATPSPSPSATAPATSTRTVSATASATRTLTPGATASLSATASPSVTASPSPSPTRSATPSATATTTATTTSTRTATASASTTPTATSTVPNSATPTSSPTVPPSNTRAPTDTSTPSPTATAPSSATASRTPTPTRTSTQTGTSTASATVTRTATSTFTETAEPTSSASPTPTPTAIPTATTSPTSTATLTRSASPTPTTTPTANPTLTATMSATPTATRTSSASPTLTAPPTATPSATATATSSPNATPSSTAPPPTASASLTQTPTADATATRTAAASSTATAEPSATHTAGDTATPSPTPSRPAPSSTASATATIETATPSPTPTATALPTDSATPLPSATATATATETAAATVSFSPSPTETASSSPTPTSRATLAATAAATASRTPLPTLSGRPSPSPTSTATAEPTLSATLAPTPIDSPTPSPTPTPQSSPVPTATAPPTVGVDCAGDCDASGAVTIDELVAMVGIALQGTSSTRCGAADRNDDGQLTIDELVRAVDRALRGCDAAEPGAG
ncbi:MAG: choice-of-anchor D domain-containing protein [Deltaproteobacteria bacterium]|nr:choice-of-anchor D domain-containing protein [Deltaproteobacteria bacterium]